jgi:hypothetical protein
MVGQATGGTSLPSTVQSGGTQSGGGTVTLSCSVVSSGSGFDIQLSAQESGAQGGVLTIVSAQGQGAVTGTGTATVVAHFGNQAVGHYTQNNCTLSYTYNGDPVPSSAGPAVAGGRIWAHIDCPMAVDSDQTATCDAQADFLFENCTGS